MEPVLKPIGFDWRIGVSLIAGVAAKEIVVSTLATIYALGSEEADLGQILINDKKFTRRTAISLMIFVLLYTPCIATLAILRKESGSVKPMLFYTVYSFAVAWLFAFVFYQLSGIIGGLL